MKPESVILRVAGRELRCPVYPEPCSYVRIVNGPIEEVYWSAEEWREDPAGVMGAVMGAIVNMQTERHPLGEE